MSSDKLYVIAVISNPIGYESRYRLYRDFELHMIQSGVELITVELAFQDKPFAVTNGNNPNHVQLRTNHILWHKENLINIGIDNLPDDCKYVAWIDADVRFVNPNWVRDTIDALKQYNVVQMFSKAADLDQFGDPMKLFDSFGAMYVKNNHTVPAPRFDKKTNKGKDNGGIYSKDVFWHPGFAWAARKDVLDQLGGVMDFPVLGSADHLMALAMLGETDRINNKELSAGYIGAIKQWEETALKVVNKSIGYVPGMLAHNFHGKKINRGYHNRTDILVRNQFDPATDLMKDTQGVYQLVIEDERQCSLGNALYEYFKSRKEDDK